MQAHATRRLHVLSGHLPSGYDSALSDREDASVQQLSVHPTKAVKPAFPQATTAVEKFPELKADYFQLDELLTPDEAAIRKHVRAFMESEVAPIINQYWEKAEFPHQLLPKLGALGIGGCNQQGHGCSGHSLMKEGLIMMELARVDPSISLAFLVHDSLCMYTIGALGNEAQKAKYLPKLASFEHVGCWAMTEPDWGSDAASLATSATKAKGANGEDGWLLSGSKRWIGNAPFADVCVAFARDTQSGKVLAFIIEPKITPGWSVEKMENKTGMRIVQNGDITLANAFVPDANRLPLATSFAAATSALAASRMIVAWQPVGMAMGVYDMCLRYLTQRTQFGAPLAAQQITQEKLMRMLANVQAMALMAWRVTRLGEKGQATPGQISLAKAWNTLRGREVCSLGRELLGGNGIVHDFHVAKVFNDMEAAHTYEGTYEVNMLVAGREITGAAAFKPRTATK